MTLHTNNNYINKDIILTLNAQSASPSFTGGSFTGIATASGNSCNISNSTNNSGVSIDIGGSVNRTAVTYDGAVSGWVEKSNGAIALAASNSASLTAATYYINGVTLTAPSSGTRSFGITVPNGNGDPITFIFSVDSNGNTTVN